MATEVSVQNQIGGCVNLVEYIDEKLNRDSPDNVESLINAIIAILDGDYTSSVTAGIEALRGFAASAVSGAVQSSMLDGLLLEYMKTLSYPDIAPSAMLERLRVDFSERGTPITVETRLFVFGSVANGGSNVGDGVFHRLTVDEYSNILEAATPEVKNMRCINDRFSGAGRGQEVFELRGEEIPKDNIAGFRSTDRLGSINSISSDDAEGLIQNPTFADVVDTTATALDAVLPGWVLTNAVGNVNSVEDGYRASQTEGDTPQLLNITADEVIFQSFDVNGGSFDPLQPYYLQMAYRLSAGGVTGTLSISLGSLTASIDLSTIADTDWHVLLPAAFDASAWFRTFNGDQLKLTITLASLAGGNVDIDDIVLAPWIRWDGTYWASVGGETGFLVNDAASVTDTARPWNEAKIQTSMWRTYDAYLPSSDTPNWPDT